jgi:hypothetical protein
MTGDEITTLVGVLTLVIGVTTFIVTEIDKRRRAVTAVLRDWQGDTIAYTVDQSGSAGLGFSEIKSKYIDDSNQHKDGRVPTHMLQDDEIRRTLYELQSKGVLYRIMENDNYVFYRRETPETMQKRMIDYGNNITNNMKPILDNLQTRQEELQKTVTGIMTTEFAKFSKIMQEMQTRQISYEQSQETYRAIQQAALQIAAHDPNRYSTDEIATDVMDRTKADRLIVIVQIISLIQNGILTLDSEGKASIRLFAPMLR